MSITQHMRHYEELLTTVKKRQLRWYEHISRTHGLSKTVLQGTVRSGRKKTRETEKNDGPTTSASGQGRTLPQPRGLCTIVRGGDNWCGVQHGSAPTTLARVKGPRQGKARKYLLEMAHAGHPARL